MFTIGMPPKSRSCSMPSEGPPAQSGVDGEPQRLLLCARSPDRRVPDGGSLRQNRPGPMGSMRKAVRLPAATRTRRWKGRWCIRPSREERTGSAPATAPRPQLFYQAAREIAGIYYKGDAEYKDGTAYTGGGGETEEWRRCLWRGSRAGSDDREIAMGVQAAHAAVGGPVVHRRRLGFWRGGRRKFLRAGCRKRQAALGTATRRRHPRQPDVVCD